MEWVIEFDIAAAVLTAIILILFLKKKNYTSKANRIYLCLMSVGLAASVLDVISVYGMVYAKQIPIWINLMINVLFLLCMNCIVFIYYFYIAALASEMIVQEHLHKHFMKFLALIDVILIASSPFSGWVFYFDAQRNYCSGSLKIVIHGIAIIVLSACLIRIVRNRQLLTATQKFCVYLYTFSNMVAAIIQCIFPKLLITNFTISLSFMIIYITLQRPEDKIDSLTQLENKGAFLEELNRDINSKNQFFLLIVKLQNLNRINDMMGVSMGNSVLRHFSRILSDAASKSLLYRIGGSRFAFLIWDEQETANIIMDIENHVKDGYEINGMLVQINARYCQLKFPQHGKTVNELENMIQFCLTKEAGKKDAKVVYADEKMLENLKRDHEIQDIIKKALVKRTFQVYYQPIYNWREDTFDSAEALIRLFDDKYGFISPEEFIPMAEKSGQILEIGDFVTDEVCRMIAANRLQDYGVKHVHINLSGVQCMQRDLDEKIKTVMKRYKLDPHIISFEVTETAALHSDSYLTETLQGITDAGFGLALDDYGSGFATFGYLLNYPFTEVKFDKEMVWQSTREEKAMIALNYVVKMMKELNLTIVAEGVETEEQAAKLREIGCDLFQGYLYAKPMPKQEYIEFLRNHQKNES